MARIRHSEVTDPEDLEPEEEKRICQWVKEKTGSEFVFVTEYPEKKRPFYTMESKEHPELTRSFDLLYQGLEITTGGLRIHNYEEQVAKLQRRGMRRIICKLSHGTPGRAAASRRYGDRSGTPYKPALRIQQCQKSISVPERHAQTGAITDLFSKSV